VRLGLLDPVWLAGGRTAAGAVALRVFLLGLGIASAAAGLLDRRAWWGVPPLAAWAVWSWLACRWVDRHDDWPGRDN
jgi:hypothetical protein